MKRAPRMIFSLLVPFFVLSLAASAFAETWDMPTPYPDATFHTVNIIQFAEDVKQATGGKLEIKVHSAGSLFKHKEIKDAVRGGQVPIGEFFVSLLSNENAVFGADSQPFLATNYDDAAKLWDAQKPIIAPLLESQKTDGAVLRTMAAPGTLYQKRNQHR